MYKWKGSKWNVYIHNRNKGYINRYIYNFGWCMYITTFFKYSLVSVYKRQIYLLSWEVWNVFYTSMTSYFCIEVNHLVFFEKSIKENMQQKINLSPAVPTEGSLFIKWIYIFPWRPYVYHTIGLSNSHQSLFYLTWCHRKNKIYLMQSRRRVVNVQQANALRLGNNPEHNEYISNVWELKYPPTSAAGTPNSCSQ